MTLLSLLALHGGPDPNRPLTEQKIRFAGFPITIEYPKGSVRELKDDSGKTVYKKFCHNAYGYFTNSKGRDGDEVDVILGPNPEAACVYVAHMLDKGPVKKEREDEDKILLGFPSYEAALTAFHLMYPKDFWGGMTVLPMADFRKKLATAALPYREKKLHARG